jgi:hypothetical protein
MYDKSYEYFVLQPKPPRLLVRALIVTSFSARVALRKDADALAIGSSFEVKTHVRQLERHYCMSIEAGKKGVLVPD